MLHETMWLDCADALLQAQQLCAQVCQQQAYSPWPHPTTPAPEAPPQEDDAQLDQVAPDPFEVAIEVLRLVQTIIDPFPLEWQVMIVNALSARTVHKVREQTQPAQTVLSA